MIKKPTPARRETIIPPKQFAEILEKETTECWRDFLNFMRETGCRVQEIRILEASHLDEQKWNSKQTLTAKTVSHGRAIHRGAGRDERRLRGFLKGERGHIAQG